MNIGGSGGGGGPVPPLQKYYSHVCSGFGTAISHTFSLV